VLAALGSTLTNKYAEGYPGRRYYGGCAEVDRAEEIGIERAKQLFGAEHANLQPHSGASANLAAYAALLRPGDPVLAMDLPHGGHLTHGSKVNFSGSWFDTVGYSVSRETELIDYDQVRDLALQHQPKMIICGATAYPRLIDFAAFRTIADEVGAYLMVDAAHFIGLVAGGAIPSPVPYADVVCFTTHKVLRGRAGGMIPLPSGPGPAHRQGGVPVHPGWSAHARGRGQGGSRSRRRGQPAVRGVHAAGHSQRPGARGRTRGRGHASGLRRYGHPPGPDRPARRPRFTHRRRLRRGGGDRTGCRAAV